MISIYQLILLSNVFFSFIQTQFIIFNKQTFDIVNNCLIFESSSHSTSIGQKDNPSRNSTTNQCLLCQNGYYLDEGKCIYIPNCTNPIVNQIDDIISCEEGVYLGYYAQSFFQCPKNCISCFKQDNEILCKGCKIGFARKQDGSCYPPPSFCIQASTIQVKLPKNDTINLGDQYSSQQQEQQSSQMTELIQCDQCQSGFITQIQDYTSPSDYYNQCIECSDIIENCQNCSLVLDQKYICNSCNEGYYLTQDKNQSSVCQQCSSNCSFCIFGQVQYNAPFILSNSQIGVEEREICLKCPKGYGFHYDGKTCVQCNQCDQCFYLINKQYVYTLGTNFKAITDEDIIQLKLQVELTCSYQTCSEGCIDQFNICQTKNKISGCSLCAAQKISSDLSQNALTCKQCFSDKQMKVQIQSTLQNQYCLDRCQSDCQQCNYDDFLQIQTCSLCKKQGNYQLEYQQAIDELNNLLGNEDMIKYNSYHYLFLLQNQKSKKCLNCLFGCYECQNAQIYQNNQEVGHYTSSIDQISFIQQVQLLSQYYPQYFKSNDFFFPPQDSVDIVNSNCIKCQDGYQLIVPQMKCIKCSENKFCKFTIQNIQYNLFSSDFDQMSFDEILSQVFGQDWFNLNHFYQMNQLDIQDIEVVLNLGKRTYFLKDSYSLNLSYMKSGKIFANSKLKLIGAGPQTVLQISQNFSILFFTQIEIQDMTISIDNQKNWVIGAFEDNSSIIFSGVVFQSQQNMGSIVLFDNFSKLEISKCVFDGNFAQSTDFIQLIDPTPFSDIDDEGFDDLTISIFGNYFTPNFTLTQYFLQTQFFSHLNINLEMKQNTFRKSKIGGFLYVSTLQDMDALSYKDRLISITDNTFDLYLFSGYSFFQDATLDYVYLNNNTIYSISVDKINDQATSFFSFFQGSVLNTKIASVQVPQAKFYLFDFTGTRDYTDIYLCIDITVKLINFTSVDPDELSPQKPSFNLLNYGLQDNGQSQLQHNLKFRHLEKHSEFISGTDKKVNEKIEKRQLQSQANIVSQYPLIILKNSQNNFRKNFEISNFYMKSISLQTNGSPLIEIEASLIVTVQNFTLQDSYIQGDVFRAQCYNFTANSIIIKNLINEHYFLISSFSVNLFISDIQFPNSEDQFSPINQLINYQDSSQINIDIINDYKSCDFDECKINDSCVIQIDICTQGMPLKKCDSIGQTVIDFCQQEEFDQSQNNENDQTDSSSDQNNKADEDIDENYNQYNQNDLKSLQADRNPAQNQNQTDYSICDILKFNRLPIIFEEFTFNTNEELISQVIIQNIQIENRITSNSLIQIKNNQNGIQKIQVKNIKLDNLIYYNSNIGNSYDLSLFMSVNSARSVLIMKNITAQGIYILDNSVDIINVNNKLLINCFLQIQVQHFLLKHSYYANEGGSKYQNLQQKYKVLDYAPRFVDFVGQTLYFNHTKFVKIASLSGGVVRASSNQNLDFFFYNMTTESVFVSKSGGLLYFYSSIGTSVYLHIQNSFFKNITSNASFGLFDINNLQNPINLNIINCDLVDISSPQTSLFQVKNMNSFVLLQDVNIHEIFHIFPIFKNEMICLKNTEVRLINIRIFNLNDYQTLFNFDQSVILFYNVSIQKVEVLLGLFLFQRSQVQMIEFTFKDSKSTFLNLNSDPTHINTAQQMFIYCQSFIEFKFCYPLIMRNVTIQNIQLNYCSNNIIYFDQSSSNIKNITLVNNTFDNRVLQNQISLLYYNQIFVSLKNQHHHILIEATVSGNILPEASKGCIRVFNTQIILRESIFSHNIVDYGGGLYIQTTNNDGSGMSEKAPNHRLLQQNNQNIKKNLNPKRKQQKLRTLDETVEIYYTQNNTFLPTNNSESYYQNFEPDKLWVTLDDQPDFKERYQNIFQYPFQFIFIIDGCQFLDNYAFSQGGAIYIDINDSSRDLLINSVAILNSDISHNIAEINSPGIGSLTFIPFLQNNSQSNNTVKNRAITAFNIAPSNLNIYYQNGSAVLNLKNITSGQLFDQGNLIVEFQNINGEKVYLNDPSLISTARKPQVFLTYDQIKIAIDTFSFENGTITILPQQYIYTPGSVVDFIFSSPNILTPVRLDGDIIFEIQTNKYEKIIKAHFRSCQIGEIYFKDKKICSPCSFGTYSLEDPKSARCTNCPQGGYCLGGNQILLLEGYWSDATIKQDEIIYCSRNPSNCVGQVSQELLNNREFKPKRNLNHEDKSQFFPCIEGHVGALCEVCDLTGLKNGLRYYQTQGYQCEKCQEIVNIYVKLGFYILISISIALITVYTLVSEIQNKIIKNALKIIGVLMVGINSQYYQIASSLFKIIINYAQINLIIYTLDLQIPSELNNIFLSIISPFKFLQTGFDCLLSDMFSLQVVFIKSIGLCLLPVLYYVILLFILTIVETLKRKFIKSYYFYTACFFITLFSIPNVIQYLALVLSCRRVGSQKYIAADVSQICYSSQHIQHIKSVIVPGIVVYGLLIPLLFVCILHFNRDKFEQNMFEMKYGFLYREYKSKVFYWEIVRLGCKEIIFLSVSIWDEQQELKAMIVCLLLIFYYGLLQRVQPFKNQLLNRYEQISTTLNIISIIIALVVKQISNSTTNILLYIFIIEQNQLIAQTLQKQNSQFAQNLQTKNRFKKFNLQKFLLTTVDKIKTDQQESFIVEGKVITPLLQANQDTDSKNIIKLQLDFQQNMINFHQAYKNTNSIKDDYYKNNEIYADNFKLKNENSPTFFSQNQTHYLNLSETPFQKKQNPEIENLQSFQIQSNDLNFDQGKKNLKFIQQENQIVHQLLPIISKEKEIELQSFNDEINNQFNVRNTFTQKMHFNNNQDSMQFTLKQQDFDQNDATRFIVQHQQNEIDNISPENKSKIKNFGSQIELKQKISNLNNIFQRDNQIFENQDKQEIHYNENEKLSQFKDLNNFSFDKKREIQDLQEISKNQNEQQNNLVEQPYNVQQNLDNDELIKFDSDDSDYDFSNGICSHKQISASNQLENAGKQQKSMYNRYAIFRYFAVIIFIALQNCSSQLIRQENEIIQNCLNFSITKQQQNNQNQSYCNTCQYGYFLYQGKCYLIKNCEVSAIIQDQYLVQCLDGSYLTFYNNSFHACPNYCNQCGFDNGQLICTSCQQGYQLMQQVSPEGILHGTYCSIYNDVNCLLQGECSINQCCLKCQKGYFLDKKTQLCTPCSKLVNNCIDCIDVSAVTDQISQIKCTTCSMGFYQQFQYDQCNQCQTYCQVCAYKFVYYFNPIKMQFGSEKRLQCLQCQDGYGFHQDGQRCVKCEDNCPLCYKQLNNLYQYTITNQFKAQLIDDITMNFSLKCLNYEFQDQCIDVYGRLSKIQKKPVDNCLLNYCGQVLDTRNIQISYLSCLKCAKGYQPILKSYQTYIAQECIDDCPNQCLTCIKDLSTNLNTCLNCLQKGKATDSNYIFFLNILSKIPDYQNIQQLIFPLFKVQYNNQSQKVRCLNCFVGCLICQSIDNGINQIDLTVSEKDLLINNFRPFFNEKSFALPQLDTILTSRQICLKCDEGYQMVYPEQKCVKCPKEGKQCKYQIKLQDEVIYFTQQLSIQLQLDQFMQTRINDAFSFYLVHQFNIQQIGQTLHIQQGYYQLKNQSSINYNFLRNAYSKQIQQANLTIIGEGDGTTQFNISSYLSILDFENVRFENITISLSKQGRLMIGNLKNFKSLIFKNVQFSNFQGCESGSILIFSNIQKLKFINCTFNNLILKQDDFIQFIPYNLYSSTKETVKNKIYIGHSTFVDSYFDKCFLNTQFLNQNNLELQINNSIFDQVTTKCFISIKINESNLENSIDFMSRNITLLNNKFNIMIRNEGFFFKDETLDYIIMVGNTIQFQEYESNYTSQSTGFVFQQGLIKNTLIDSYKVQSDNLVLFDLTGQYKYNQMQDYCFDNIIRIANFTFKSDQIIEITAPVMIIKPSMFNRLKSVYLENIFIYDITRMNNQPYYIFDLQGLLIISLKNFICKDAYTDGQYFKLAAKIVYISEIKISLIHQLHSLFTIYSQQAFISDIKISNDFELQMSNIIDFQQANYLDFAYSYQIKGFTYEDCMNYTSCYTNKQNDLCYYESHSIQTSSQYLDQFNLYQEILQDNVIFYKEVGIAQVIISNVQIFQAIISRNMISIACSYQPAFISISNITFKESEFVLDNTQINLDQQQQFLFFVYSDQSLVSLVDIFYERFNSIVSQESDDNQEWEGNKQPNSFQNKIQALIFLYSEIIYIKNVIANTPLKTNHSILMPHQFLVQESKFIQFIAKTFILKDSIFNDFSCSKGGLLISPIQQDIDLYMQNVTLKKVNSEGDGGVLYFYLIESSRISINLQSCVFDNISKDQGGIIAIDNSNDRIYIIIQDTFIKNVFSSYNTLISIPQQGICIISLKNTTITEDKNQIHPELVKKSMIQIKGGIILFQNVIIDSISNYDLIFIFDNSEIFFHNVTLNAVSTHSGIIRAKFLVFVQFTDTTIQNAKRLSTQVTIENLNSDEITKQVFGYCNPDMYFYMGEFIHFQNVTFSNNEVLPCAQSFISVQNSNFYFDNVTVKNNYCNSVDYFYQEFSFIQFAGEHYKKKEYGNLIINSQFYHNHLYGNSFGIINLSNLRVFITKSTFEKNYANYGGAIYFQQIDAATISNQNDKGRILEINSEMEDSLQKQYDYIIESNYKFIIKYNFKYQLVIDQCNFFQNTAMEGGALYLDNQRGTTVSLQFAILNSTFINNNASENSPAISCLKYIPSVINALFQNNTLGNNTEVNPLNIAPSQIQVSNTTEEDINFFSNFISGVEIQSNITLKFKDLSNQTVFLNTKNTDLIPQVFLSYDTNKIALENYEPNTGQLYLGNISFIYQPGQNATFSLTSRHIITPILDENQIVTSFSNKEYIKNIIVEFRNCTPGEIYLSQKKICQLCPSGSYSRQNSKNKNSDVCLTCPEGADCPGGNIVNTIDGYWQDSSIQGEEKEIFYCLYSQSNCLSNSNSTYQNITDPLQKLYFPCKLGHVGALCQSCDTQRLMSNVTFYEDGLYQCSLCSDKLGIYLKVGFVITGGLVLALLTVYSIINEAQNKIIKNVLKLFGILSLGTASQYSPASSSLFKILINHSQINLIAFSLSQDIPQQLTQIINMIVSPFRLIKTGFDCLLSQLFVEKLVFIKTIFFSLQPIIFYVLIMLCFTIIEVIRKKMIKSYYFYTSCFFVALYLVPQVIQQLILAISCQTVGQNKYMIADMTIICFSDIHIQYIKYIIIPGLIVYGVLIPILMITLLCVNKKHFTSSYFEIKYGFLYKEFKPNLFYWEILRLLFKVFIYSFIGLWKSEIQTKGLISILILILYFELFQKLKPFKNLDVNLLELTSIQINIISLTLVVFAYQIRNIGFQFFVYMVIIGLNFYFFYQVAKQLYKINRKQIIHLKNKIIALLKKVSTKCFKRFSSVKSQINDQNKSFVQDLNHNTIKKNNWKKLRDYFKFYKKFKQEQKNSTLSLFSLEIIKQYQISKALESNKEKFNDLEDIEGKQIKTSLKKQQSVKQDSVGKKKLYQSVFSFRSADQLIQDSNIDIIVNTQFKNKSCSTEFSERVMGDSALSRQLTRFKTKTSRRQQKSIHNKSTVKFLEKNFYFEQSNKNINKTLNLKQINQNNKNSDFIKLSNIQIEDNIKDQIISQDLKEQKEINSSEIINKLQQKKNNFNQIKNKEMYIQDINHSQQE
ncbi:transmembrane protein, putative (macronuclear) [Tetrahymena thermophila SB210]|uniref:Transmembrane protein, putative n=1 Tax=Tetrahymena thermophila (strain SB210) TaxID=312017 RepID=I7MCY5_TETTS|nr:transmembrane protein, putative [Tetrahymena thermophila SB210]EAR85154.2 transmembrane protein, putative [Tetrahymena thermophila SB210]|eukprot:XP_001032817.2 transmembrane protein, putative [Tetrahymena thermophila SB210]